MSWSYSGDPSASSLDKVRFLSGDTDTNNQQISNEEITFLLSEWNSDAYIAASEACVAIAGKLTAKADMSRSVGDLSISTQYGAQAGAFMGRAERLREQAGRAAAPVANFFTDDNSNVFGPTRFSVGMDEYQ